MFVCGGSILCFVLVVVVVVVVVLVAVVVVCSFIAILIGFHARCYRWCLMFYIFLATLHTKEGERSFKEYTNIDIVIIV